MVKPQRCRFYYNCGELQENESQKLCSGRVRTRNLGESALQSHNNMITYSPTRHGAFLPKKTKKRQPAIASCRAVPWRPLVAGRSLLR